jgi:hypothetical protein
LLSLYFKKYIISSEISKFYTTLDKELQNYHNR